MKKKSCINIWSYRARWFLFIRIFDKKRLFSAWCKRRSSSFNTGRIDHIYQDPFVKKEKFFLHYGDVTDAISVSSLIKKIRPNEIYNLAAQSHVSVSFEVPEYTANADALGALRILEAIKFHGFEKTRLNFIRLGLLKCSEK